MAERRMFAKTIVDSDAFLEMPVSARLLYYDLGMRADDDGFVNSPKKIMRMVGASPDDLNILALRKFIIPFDNGVVVIKHWKIHNYIQNDRYHETAYKEQKDMLELDENKAYRLPKSGENVPCIQDGYNMDTQVRLGKDRLELGKDRLGNTPPLSPPPGETGDNLEELFGYNQFLLEAVRDWLTYKKEKRQNYKGTGLKSFLTQIKNRVAEYGEDAVISVIQESMAQNYQGITWDKLKQQNKQSSKSGYSAFDILRREQENDQNRNS